ncbi:MAG TPA: hypothetical protein VFP72_23095, partial [Kineosporiaceae bacterium]|nr:hypothetical protein [Kineosporiaceae bacterium]
EGLLPAVTEVGRLPQARALGMLDAVRDALVTGAVRQVRPGITPAELAAVRADLAQRWTSAEMMGEYHADGVARPLWQQVLPGRRVPSWLAAVAGGLGLGAARAADAAQTRERAESLVDRFGVALGSALGLGPAPAVPGPDGLVADGAGPDGRASVAVVEDLRREQAGYPKPAGPVRPSAWLGRLGIRSGADAVAPQARQVPQVPQARQVPPSPVAGHASPPVPQARQVPPSPVAGHAAPHTPSQPAVLQPSTPQPSTSEPSTSEPSTSEPSTPEPSTPEPSTPEPSTPSKPQAEGDAVPGTRPDPQRLGWTWGVIKGTAIPPGEDQWRRRRLEMLQSAKSSKPIQPKPILIKPTPVTGPTPRDQVGAAATLDGYADATAVLSWSELTGKVLIPGVLIRLASSLPVSSSAPAHPAHKVVAAFAKRNDGRAAGSPGAYIVQAVVYDQDTDTYYVRLG